MVPWATRPPFSQSAGFPNRVAIPCSNNQSCDLWACVVSSMRLDSVTLPLLVILGVTERTQRVWEEKQTNKVGMNEGANTGDSFLTEPEPDQS